MSRSGRSVVADRASACAYDRQVGVHREIDQNPPAFETAIELLRAAPLRPEIAVSVMPAPQRIAPYAIALSGEVTVRGDDLATGRFILLHDPAGHDAWAGTFRCVTFARADVEPEMAADPSLPTVGWSWLTDALDSRGARHAAASGSVTVVTTETFGEMSEDDGDAQIEVRASWTPDGDVGEHLSAWSELLCAIAGLPPLAPGVVPMVRPRSSR